jgi:hypothetical protein
MMSLRWHLMTSLTRLLRWYSTLKVCTFIVLFWFSSLNTKPIKTRVSIRGQNMLSKFSKLFFLHHCLCYILLYILLANIFYMGYFYFCEIQLSWKCIFRKISSNFKIIVTCYLLQVHVLSSYYTSRCYSI